MPVLVNLISIEDEVCAASASLLARLARRRSFRIAFLPGALTTELVSTAEVEVPSCLMSLTKSRSLATTGSWILFWSPDDPASFPELRFFTSFRASVKPEIVIDLVFSTRPGLVLLSDFKSILTGIVGLLVVGVAAVVGGDVRSGRLKRLSSGRSFPTPDSGAVFGSLEGGRPYNPIW